MSDILWWTHHMSEQLLDDPLELICNSSVQTQDVVQRTGRVRWMIETNSEKERETDRQTESGKSVLAALHDDDIYGEMVNFVDSVNIWTLEKLILL